ncbi:hypothetical protein L7F22_022055 [Adiantum nelumboides]|nr:hypothetical protein [Adiantum nelumboides]
MFKSQLQEYAQKAGLASPVYEVIKEGPPHEPQFKASVTIHGKVFESPTFYGNLKKAEHAAAELALASLGKTEIGQLTESGLCKNLLQEYAQKCKLPLPVYSVEKFGEIPSQMFNATVEIAGVQYSGGKCKTRKEAEIKAARTALVAIYADSGAVEDQAADEKPASQMFKATVEIAGVQYSGGKCKTRKEAEIKAARTALVAIYADSGASPLGAVEDQAADEKPASTAVEGVLEPKPGKKRKLCKVGDVSRKQKVKEEQNESAEVVGNIGAAVDASEQANGSPSKASTLQVLEQELPGSPADSCTAAAAKVASSNSGSAQEQRA